MRCVLRLAGAAMLAVAALAAAACDADRTRTGFTGPLEVPDLVGSYTATVLKVERPGSVNDLLRAPDTRLNVHLWEDGTTQGQLKITSDPQFFTKQNLIGHWFVSPGRIVDFDFRGPPTFLEEMEFRVLPDGLAGEWKGPDAQVHVELAKVG